MVNIKGLSKAKVLAELYNNSIPLGFGWFQYDSAKMTEEEAAKLLEENPYGYFDYLKGRVMKVDLTSDDEFDPRLYDRDNGEGAAQAVINSIRNNQ